MPTRLLLLLSVALLTTSCSGGDKHLPSSNPPEYDPKKVYTTPAVSPSTPVQTSAKPPEPGPPPIQLPPLEPGPNEKGEWKKVPVNLESLQLLKGVKNTCEALTKMVQGSRPHQQCTERKLGEAAEVNERQVHRQIRRHDADVKVRREEVIGTCSDK